MTPAKLCVFVSGLLVLSIGALGWLAFCQHARIADLESKLLAGEVTWNALLEIHDQKLEQLSEDSQKLIVLTKSFDTRLKTSELENSAANHRLNSIDKDIGISSSVVPATINERLRNLELEAHLQELRSR